MGDSAESHELHLKVSPTLKEIVRTKIYINELHYPRPLPPILEILPSSEKNDSALCAIAQNDIRIKVSWQI
jgi:hypothetical protein